MSDNNVVPLPRNHPALLGDTYVNLLSGIGGPLDRIQAMTYTFNPFNAAALEAAYRGNWIARKVIDIPADDSTREWRTWQANANQITALEDLERELGVQHKLCDAMKKARLFGGALIVLGLKGSDKPEQPLDIEKVKKGDLQYLHVLSRVEVSSGQIDLDVMSETYGHPSYYQVAGMGNMQRIHPSRCVRLLGIPRIGRHNIDGWGDPVLDSVDEAIKASGLVTNGVAQMVSEAKVDVISIPGLTDRIMDDTYRSNLTRRFDFANARKSVLNALILDGQEKWERITTNFSTLPDILKMYLLLVCGASDIPATRFLGQSAVGLNATGENDIRNYYDSVKSKQTNLLTPAISSLDEVLIRSALGDKPKDVWYEWDSLWQETDEEKLAKAERKAKIFQIDAITGLLPEMALGKARENQLIEDGTYPGLEEAIEEAEAEAEKQLQEEARKRQQELAAWFAEPEEEQVEDPFSDFGANFAGAADAQVQDFTPELHPRIGKGDPRGGQFAKTTRKGPVGKAAHKKMARAALGRDLTEEEKDALDEYMGSGYEQINHSLRHNKSMDRYDKRYMERIEQVLSESSLSKPVMTWRGVSPRVYGRLEASVGKTVVDHGFTSVTSKENIARNFMNEYADFTRGSTGMKPIRVFLPKGAKAFPVAHVYSGYHNEHELLIQRNTRYRVGQDKQGLYVTYLGQKKGAK